MAPPSPDMTGPRNERPDDDGRIPDHRDGGQPAPNPELDALLAELSSQVKRDEIELRASVVMFCNNAADEYQSLTLDELDECREVKRVRDYLNNPPFKEIRGLKERFDSARQIIREEGDAYLGDPETVETVVTFFDSHLLAESASLVISEVITAQVRAMNAGIEDRIMRRFLEESGELIDPSQPLDRPSREVERDGKQEGSHLSDQVEAARKALGATLREHLGLKVRFGDLVTEAMNVFSTYFCSSCNIDSEYLAATERNLEVAFQKPFEDALVNSYLSRYGQIVQTLIGTGALQAGDRISPLLENRS